VPLTQLIVLAVIQGLTEFLPISSSGHLALVPMLTDWPDQGLPMDVAVHVGTLCAVVIYFWRDLWEMAAGLFNYLRGRRDPAARLAIQIIVATIPVLVAAWAFEKYVGDSVRTMKVIAWTTLGYGILMYIADRISLTVRRVEHATFGDALIIGMAQILALVPGTSRSGITITAARFLGYERAEAARFSFLMSVPTISAGGLWLLLKLREAESAALTNDALLGITLSFVVGIFAIAFMMRWLRRSTLTVFVVYRLILGAVLLAIAYKLVP